jgi:hypothetical protein
MHFRVKNTLKNNRNHIPNMPKSRVPHDIHEIKHI